MKKGDIVRFLNDVGGGVVSRIEGKTAYVTDSDGFDTPVLVTQCVVVPQGSAATIAEPDTLPEPTRPASPKTAVPTENSVALIFEPHDIKRLSQSPLDLYLVNDTPDTLYFSLASHDRLDTQWTLVAHGMAEPASQEFIAEYLPTELNALENISLQAIALDTQKPFDIAEPISFQQRFDVTRLAKLHCYVSTPYSATPVVTLPVITHGKPHQPVQLTMLTAPIEPKDAPRKTPAPIKAKVDERVVDLHASALLDNTAGLQPADILSYQLDTFRAEMKQALADGLRSMVFIHGKGEGVLRRTILDELRRRWPRCQSQDASFQEYGFGATKVILRR